MRVVFEKKYKDIFFLVIGIGLVASAVLLVSTDELLERSNVLRIVAGIYFTYQALKRNLIAVCLSPNKEILVGETGNLLLNKIEIFEFDLTSLSTVKVSRFGYSCKLVNNCDAIKLPYTRETKEMLNLMQNQLFCKIKGARS